MEALAQRSALAPPVGVLLRTWRARRRFSQLDFALEAGISQRHLSFVESGRAVPSRDMVLLLADHLDLPLRDRNALLLAAGYAPLYPARSLEDPTLAPARAAVDQLLASHAPFPALAVDGHWTLVAANAPAQALLGSMLPPTWLAPPLNLLRASLSPDGLGPRIANLPQWRRHLLDRLRRQVAAAADPVLRALLAELEALPAAASSATPTRADEVFVPLLLDAPAGRLSFFSTVTTFGTPMDVTLSEIQLESFFPADEATRAALMRAA